MEEQIVAGTTVPLWRAELLVASHDLQREGNWEK